MNDSAFIESVRLGSDTKLHLATLKKRTGVPHWNTLCRWGFCLSLSDSGAIRARHEKDVGAIEMTWRTFAGDDDEIYRLLLLERCRRDMGLVTRENLGMCLRAHIARGTARLVANRRLKSLGDLLSVATTSDHAAILTSRPIVQQLD